jgi:hypothetical protein
MQTDHAMSGERSHVEGVMGCRSWDDRVAMIRKAMQEGIPLNRIEQELDSLDYLLQVRKPIAFPNPFHAMELAKT